MDSFKTAKVLFNKYYDILTEHIHPDNINSISKRLAIEEVKVIIDQDEYLNNYSTEKNIKKNLSFWLEVKEILNK